MYGAHQDADALEGVVHFVAVTLEFEAETRVGRRGVDGGFLGRTGVVARESEYVAERALHEAFGTHHAA